MADERTDWPGLVAALVQGDRYLNADACAVYLGMVTPQGKPNRWGFLERVACRPEARRAPPDGAPHQRDSAPWKNPQKRKKARFPEPSEIFFCRTFAVLPVHPHSLYAVSD